MRRYRAAGRDVWTRDPAYRERQRTRSRERYRTDEAFRERQKAATRAWAAKNPERKKATAMANHRLRHYGLTADAYVSLWEAQSGRCAACGADFTSRRAHVDHDHETANVRGLLCHNCNIALGLLGDDPALIERLATYRSHFLVNRP